MNRFFKRLVEGVDPIVPTSEVEQLQELLTNKGAVVSLHWESNGHSISSTEIEAAKMWLATNN